MILHLESGHPIVQKTAKTMKLCLILVVLLVLAATSEAGGGSKFSVLFIIVLAIASFHELLPLYCIVLVALI